MEKGRKKNFYCHFFTIYEFSNHLWEIARDGIELSIRTFNLLS